MFGNIIKKNKTGYYLLPLFPCQYKEGNNEGEEDVVIAPGREGGTNALFLRKPYKFAVSYYGISCLKHIETAKLRDLSYAIHDSFFISTDVDEVGDLIELLIHGGGGSRSRSRSFSAEYLREIGVSIHADKNTKMRAKIKVGVGR